MLDRAILVLRKEYPIAAGHVTDRLEGAGQKAPPLGLGAPELGIVLQHLWRVALRVEGDRDKHDLCAEIRPQRVLPFADGKVDFTVTFAVNHIQAIDRGAP